MKTSRHFSTRDIKVLVVDEQYETGSQNMVAELTSLSIESYRVSLASVFTVMPKITKVIVGSYAVLADGGILGFSGIYALGMIAKEFSVPFLVVSSLYKLTPKYSFNQQTFNSFLNPNQIIKLYPFLT